MVRKKMKKAPEASEHPNVDLNSIVVYWLKALDLPGHEAVPTISLDVDIFSLLQSAQCSSDQSSFTQVRGLQALRAAVARGNASADEVRLLLLVSLLLFIDPDTSPLRKCVKSLLHAAESAIEALGSETDVMVELVTVRFLDYFRVMIPSTSPPTPTMVMPAMVQRMQQRTQEDTALRMVASLRWLAEVPAGKRALLKAQGGSVFIGCITVLGDALDMRASVIKRWHGRGGGVSGGVSGGAVEALGGELEPRDSEEGGVAAADLSAALDACSEVLKTAASLVSLTK